LVAASRADVSEATVIVKRVEAHQTRSGNTRFVLIDDSGAGVHDL
jgi:hypothetical protein